MRFECGNLKSFVNHTTVTDFTEGDKCSNCGGCCTRLLYMNSKEIKKIKTYVEKNHIKLISRNFLPESTISMICPFRDEEKQICRIYEVRPLVCRTFQCNQSVEEMNKHKAFFSARYKCVDIKSLF